MSDLINYGVKVIIVYISYFSIVSAILKLSSFEYFIANNHKITNYKIDDSLLKYSGFIFILLELILPSIIVIEGNINHLYILALGILYIIATLSILPSAIKGKRIECGCFGIYFKTQINWIKIMENIIYISTIFLVILLEDTEITLSIYFYSFLLMIVRIFFLRKKE